MPLLIYVLNRVLNVYIFIVFINVILSWIVLSTRNDTLKRVYLFTGQLVDPILQPLRNAMQPLSRNIGIDFSPMVLLFLLYFLQQLLIM